MFNSHINIQRSFSIICFQIRKKWNSFAWKWKVDEGSIYFCSATKKLEMADHSHKEPEQNEIGGPVVFALMCFAVVITIIYFIS